MRSRFLFLLICTSVCMTAAAQGKGWWTVRDGAVSYILPDDWSSDPFSSSSVCDCPGTINDNGNWDRSDYVGMVIYPVTADEMNDAERQQVWGHIFVPDGPVSTETYGNIAYDVSYGRFPGMEGDPTVMRLVSADKVKRKERHLIVYIFGADAAFNAELPRVREILESFRRRNVRQ